jgi:hypothetical protein
VGSLGSGGPPQAEVAWVHQVLLAGEFALWEQMSGPDRRHSVIVARRVQESDDGAVPLERAVLAAALLHDVGKLGSDLGTLARVAATLLAMGFGRRRVAAWTGPLTGRVGAYFRHPELGAALLTRAGSDPITVTWAAQHHSPAAKWSLPRPLAEMLKAADDD